MIAFRRIMALALGLSLLSSYPTLASAQENTTPFQPQSGVEDSVDESASGQGTATQTDVNKETLSEQTNSTEEVDSSGEGSTLDENSSSEGSTPNESFSSEDSKSNENLSDEDGTSSKNENVINFGENFSADMDTLNVELISDESLPLPEPVKLKESAVPSFHSAMPQSINNKGTLKTSRTQNAPIVVDGAITTEGAADIYTISLQPGEYIYVNMQCPLNESLNYDLMLAEFDSTTQSLTNWVDISAFDTYFNTYADGTRKTCDEGVSTQNPTASIKDYAIVVLASKGASATDQYHLYVSTSLNCGVYEPNQNANWATTLSGYEKAESDVDIPNSLVTSCDVDWYKFTTPSAWDYKIRQVWAGGANNELYTLENNKLVLQNTSDGYRYNLNLNTTYYARVSGPTCNYSFRIMPLDLIPHKIVMQFKSNNSSGISEYRTYKEGTHYTFAGTDLSMRVAVTSIHNYPLRSSAYITAKWMNGGNFTSDDTVLYGDYESNWTSYNNFTNITKSLGSKYTTFSNPQSAHYYDLDTVTVTVECNGGTLTQSEDIYHFSHKYGG